MLFKYWSLSCTGKFFQNILVYPMDPTQTKNNFGFTYFPHLQAHQPLFIFLCTSVHIYQWYVEEKQRSIGVQIIQPYMRQFYSSLHCFHHTEFEHSSLSWLPWHFQVRARRSISSSTRLGGNSASSFSSDAKAYEGKRNAVCILQPDMSGIGDLPLGTTLPN